MNEEMTAKLARYMQENGYYDTELIRKDEGQGEHARFWAIFGDDDDQQEGEKSEMLLVAEAHNAAKAEADKEAELVATFAKSDDELTEREWQMMVEAGFAIIVEVDAPADYAAPTVAYRRITPAQNTDARQRWNTLRNTARHNRIADNRQRRETTDNQHAVEVRNRIAEMEATRKAAHEYAKAKADAEHSRLKAEYEHQVASGNGVYWKEGTIIAGQGLDTYLYCENGTVEAAWFRARFGNTDRQIGGYDGMTIEQIKKWNFKLVPFSGNWLELYHDYEYEFHRQRQHAS